jgi:hypothetical protein
MDRRVFNIHAHTVNISCCCSKSPLVEAAGGHGFESAEAFHHDRRDRSPTGDARGHGSVRRSRSRAPSREPRATRSKGKGASRNSRSPSSNEEDERSWEEIVKEFKEKYPGRRLTVPKTPENAIPLGSSPATPFHGMLGVAPLSSDEGTAAPMTPRMGSTGVSIFPFLIRGSQSKPSQAPSAPERVHI